MAAAGAVATRLLLLLLMAAAAPSRARGSGCRSGAAVRGVGVEGREGEGCGTVGLLLEHSFEIGESSNVLAWTLYLVPHEVRNSGLGPPSARHTICVLWGGERMET